MRLDCRVICMQAFIFQTQKALNWPIHHWNKFTEWNLCFDTFLTAYSAFAFSIYFPSVKFKPKILSAEGPWRRRNRCDCHAALPARNDAVMAVEFSFKHRHVLQSLSDFFPNLFSTVETQTVSPKKRKNNRGKLEDVVCSDTENSDSDPKQKLTFANQVGMWYSYIIYTELYSSRAPVALWQLENLTF